VLVMALTFAWFLVVSFEALHLAHLEAMRDYYHNSSEEEVPIMPRFFELHDIISMRKGPLPIFSYVVRNFYPLLVGSREFGMRCSCDCTSKIVTTSDEALIVLLLENNYSYWTQIAKAIHDGVDVRSRKRFEWSVQPKWTCVEDSKNMEWSKEGLLRFVELQKMLAEERRSVEGTQLEKDLVTEWSNKSVGDTTSKKRKRADDDDDDSVCMPIYDDDDNVLAVEI
jgi:hypothetical protein